MAPARLCKAASSFGEDHCPAVYTTDDPGWLIAQGKILSIDDLTALLDHAADETAVRVPTETVVRAIAHLFRSRGEVDLADQMECALAEFAVVAT